jgi:hypothetical protein
MVDTYLQAMWCTGGVNLIRAFVRNLRTWWLAMTREKAQAVAPRGRKYRCAEPGADYLVVPGGRKARPRRSRGGPEAKWRLARAGRPGSARLRQSEALRAAQRPRLPDSSAQSETE